MWGASRSGKRRRGEKEKRARTAFLGEVLAVAGGEDLDSDTLERDEGSANVGDDAVRAGTDHG